MLLPVRIFTGQNKILVVEWVHAEVTSLLEMKVPCASMLQGFMYEDFHTWWGHGGLVVVEHPV